MNAVRIDGNNNFYPFAYAVMVAENYETWKWFIEYIIEDVEIVNDHGWTIISDKQKGLIKAIEELILNAENRFCWQHLHANFANAGHRGQGLGELLWECAKVTNVRKFNETMEELRKAYPKHINSWKISHHINGQCQTSVLTRSVTY